VVVLAELLPLVVV
jgi:hypothetical protein